ncbi:unnamed protein product [Penicillium salamii]|uniref:NACHT domain-containing protein n=1 Tax=Penicillium salamii TaxID=1612424 RepID=A0A9W4JM89_9EURO|nr:unnamed protein product [Penicillium salamii]CAG8121829.1 unnamed protein product [Penicillium salamii]CAG8229060.1 unnamed protein product [Penicillium salamii]CAG8309648.1 unnamed protein product [Penicillium salamii]CAG8331294.1 unnamed protein product [Penicillium salamii]
MEMDSLAKIKKLKKWLSPTDSDSPTSEFRRHLHSHVKDTGEWIFETEQYREWSMTDSTGNLWIRGIPGCGKSVVAANLVGRLQDLDDAPVLFYFFREIIETNGPAELVRDFCEKLLASSPGLQSSLEKLRADFSAVESVPFDQLWECLATALRSMERVYCVVDALDEMRHGHGRWLEQLLDLGRQSPRSIKIITTSRQVPQVEKYMQGTSIVDLRLDRLHVDHDISVFIKRQLKDAQLELELPEIDNIAKAICEQGKGLFLYARLMLDELLLHPKNIHTRVHSLPDGLGDLYTGLLREWVARSGTSARFQKLILEWVTHAGRPLRMLELADMVESLPDRGGLTPGCNVKDAVRTACGPVLEVCEDGAVQVIHHSLTEFVLNRDVEHTQMSSLSRDHAAFDSTAVHSTMAQTCLRYLTSGPLREWKLGQHSEDRKDQRKSLFLKFYFLRYAAEHWVFHVSNSKDLNKDLIQTLENFYQNGSDYQAWNEIWRVSRDDLPHPCSVLHVAAYSGLVSLANHLLSQGSSSNDADKVGHTPLVYAVMKGQHEMVSLLLGHGASHDVKVQWNENIPRCHIIPYACKLNHVDVVRALINGGVDPMAHATIGGGTTQRFKFGVWDIYSGPYYWSPRKDVTALASACEKGCTEAVLELISLVDPPSLYKDNLLHITAEKGKHEILSALLKHENVQLTINDPDVYGDTPIYLAARKRNAAAIQVLLNHGANPSILSMNRNFPPEPPTQFESSIGPRPPPSYTPLHAVAFGIPRGGLDFGKDEDILACIDVLLGAGCDINAGNYKKRTPIFEWSSLHWADEAEKFVSGLLERGADATIVDIDGQTPLHASNRAYPKIAKIFVDAGCDINAQRISDGMTVLMLNANQQNHPDPAALHELGADFEQQDWLGNTALHHNFKRSLAGSNCHADEWLSKSNLYIRNYLGRAPLHELLYQENGLRDDKNDRQLEWLQSLDGMLKRGVSLEEKDGFGRTALLVALLSDTSNPLKLVKELLQRGANAQVADSKGRTALHYAFQPSYKLYSDKDDSRRELAQLLIEHGASVQATDHDGNSIFNHFIKNQEIVKRRDWTRYEKRAETIIELGVPYLKANNQGRTALHAASEVEEDIGSSPINPRTRLEFLSQSSLHLNINEEDNLGITPLHLAASASDINALTLIEHGANIKAKDKSMRTPLSFAAEAGQSNVVGLLLELYHNDPALVNHQCIKRRSALHEASRSGSPESVKLLLDAGADPLLPDERGRTALHVAAEFESRTGPQKAESEHLSGPPLLESLQYSGRPREEKERDAVSRMGVGIASDDGTRCIREVVRLLLAAGARPAQIDRNGHRPLDVAVMLGCAPVADELKRNDVECSIKSLDPIGESLLLLTDAQIKDMVDSTELPENHTQFLERLFATGNESLVEEFVRTKQLKLTHTDEDGDKCKKRGIFLLPRLGLTSMLARLLPYLEDIANAIPDLLDLAAQRSSSNLEMVKFLIQQIPRENRDILAASLSKLCAGKRWWHSKAVVLLLESGVSPNARVSDRGEYAITNALAVSECGSMRRHKWGAEILRILLKYGADPNCKKGKYGWTPFHTAVATGADLETITLLLEHGASMGTESASSLNAAIRESNLPLIELLLKAGADANGADDPQNIPLLQKVSCPNTGNEIRSEHEAIMSFLLRYGADPLRSIENGSTTVFHKLCGAYYDPPLGPILAMGIDIDIRDSQGRTALSNSQKVHMAVALIEAGADIHATDHAGCTALYHAADKGRPDIIIELLKRSAAVDIVTNDGFTPLTRALDAYGDCCSTQHFATLNALLDGGANPLSLLPDGRSALHCLASALRDSSNKNREAQIEEDGGEDHFTMATLLYQRFLDAGCDRNACDNNGETPIFHYVRAPKSYSGRDWIDFAPVRTSHPDDWALFIATHDVSKTNLAGDTLLHAIARREESPCDSSDDESLLFKALVDLGLNPRKENNQGETALDIAATQEKTEILDLFARKE